MIEKIKAILNSVRFWSFAIGEAGLFFSDMAANGFSLAKLWALIGAILVTAGTIGTIDKFGENIGQNKTIAKVE